MAEPTSNIATSLASAIQSAVAQVLGAGGLAVAGWNWLAGHDIAWFVGASSLVLIWMQIADRLRGKGRAR
ncbi:hypothetical protein CFB43_06635 [Burkholderia sp. AU15512]|nr:hypothetical protein CFB43_06635 [Burkholderia sp. AU15512]